MAGGRCGGGKFIEAVDGVVSESWQDRCQIVADRQPESAATLDYGEDGGDLWSSLCAADVDPVFSSDRDGAHGVLGEVVG